LYQRHSDNELFIQAYILTDTDYLVDKKLLLRDGMSYVLEGYTYADGTYDKEGSLECLNRFQDIVDSLRKQVEEKGFRVEEETQ
jgi:hypothetical protein